MTKLRSYRTIVGMKSRYIEGPIKEFCFADHKMAFVSGPRQCGKITMAKSERRASSGGLLLLNICVSCGVCVCVHQR